MQPQIYKYDLSKYNFSKVVQENVFPLADELKNVHLYYEAPKEVVSFETENKTLFHSMFYEWLNSQSGNKIKVMFYDFIKNNIAPQINEPFMYQTFPTARFHLPGNRAISKWHYDSDQDHKHPDGEKNFIIALTDCFDTNATWTETQQDKKDFQPIKMVVGEYCNFDGNKCVHGNKINETGFTRVSFDFRILTVRDFENQNTKISVTTNRKFEPGSYYSMFEEEKR